MDSGSNVLDSSWGGNRINS